MKPLKSFGIPKPDARKIERFDYLRRIWQNLEWLQMCSAKFNKKRKQYAAMKSKDAQADSDSSCAGKI